MIPKAWRYPGRTVLPHGTIEEKAPFNYYIFLFLKKGRGNLLTDCKKNQIADTVIHCILYGKTHFFLIQ